jgi:hypothetical protein
VHDRGRRLPVQREPVQNLLEIVHRAQPNEEQVAVLSRDAVALEDLRRVFRDLGDPVELAHGRPDANHRCDREAEGARIDLRPIADDHPGLLQTLHTLGHRRGGQAYAAPELGHGQPGVGLELAQDPSIRAVQQPLVEGDLL